MMQSPITGLTGSLQSAPVTACKACLHLEPKKYVNMAKRIQMQCMGLKRDVVTAVALYALLHCD